MGLYEELSLRKARGEPLKFEELSVEDLKRLFVEEEISDRRLAELFDVKPSKVRYKRTKHGITIRNGIIDDLLSGKSEAAKEENLKAKKRILIHENISAIAKAITHFAFRNGPVEEMHAHPNNQLSENDMKVLNKFMVNRLAYVFTLIIEERWVEFEFLVRHIDAMFGHDWDEAEPDDGNTRELIKLMLQERIK